MNRLLLAVILTLPMWPALAQENPDAHFIQKAVAGGLGEIDGGMLAQHQGSSKAVISFGEMMVKDHRAANDRLRAMAEGTQVDLPIKASAADTAKRIEIQALSGEAFDKAYIEWQILAHRDAIAMFKEESASGDDIGAKNFATETLPTLQLHLSMLMAIPVTAPAPAAVPAPAAAPVTAPAPVPSSVPPQ